MVPEHARMDSPCTVGRSRLRCHGAIVKSQLWHLTADALQRGQEFARGGQRLLAPLLFEQVWHHLRYLGGADCTPALTAGWKIPTNCEMDTCWRVQTLYIYIIIYDEMKRPDVREAKTLRSYSFSQGWTGGSAGQKSWPKPLHSELVQSRLGLWWKMLQPGDRKQGSLKPFDPITEGKRITSLLQYTGFLDYNKCSPDELDLTASWCYLAQHLQFSPTVFIQGNFWITIQQWIPWSVQAEAEGGRLQGKSCLFETGQTKLHHPSGEAGSHPESRSGSAEKQTLQIGVLLWQNASFRSKRKVLNLKVTSLKWMSDIYFAVLQKFQNRRQTLRAVVLYIKDVSVLQGGNSYFLITQQGNNSFCVKYHKPFPL